MLRQCPMTGEVATFPIVSTLVLVILISSRLGEHRQDAVGDVDGDDV